MFHFPLLGRTKLHSPLQSPQLQPGLRGLCVLNCPESLAPTQGVGIWQRMIRGCQELKASERFTAAPQQFGELPRQSCYMRGTLHLPSTATPECCVKSTGGGLGTCSAPAELRDTGLVQLWLPCLPHQPLTGICLPLCYVKICFKAHCSSKLT